MLTREEMIKTIIEVLNDELAIDIKVLKVSELTIIADHFIIASGKNAVHIRSIVAGVINNLQEKGINPQRVDGSEEGRWVVVDYGFIIVHLFRQEEREYYKLEKLWGDAEVVDY